MLKVVVFLEPALHHVYERKIDEALRLNPVRRVSYTFETFHSSMRLTEALLTPENSLLGLTTGPLQGQGQTPDRLSGAPPAASP